MKKSFLPFKVYQVYKKRCKNFLYIGLLASCISCLPILESFDFSFQPFSEGRKIQTQSEKKYLTFPQAQEEKPIIKIAKETCSRLSDQKLLIEFRSPFGKNELYIKRNTAPEKTLLSMNNQTLSIENFDFFLNPTIIKHICHKVSLQPSFAIQKEELIIQVKKWLRQITPNCVFTYSPTNGWQCKLAEPRAINLKKTLSLLKNHILRRWKRQPYILARRLILSRMLLEIESSQNDTNNLSDFCAILESSSKVELPLAMQSLDWQKKLCSPQTNKEQLSELINYTLYYSVLELKMLKKLGSKLARKGHIYIRLPRKRIYSKELWIQLEASTNLHRKLASYALSLNKVNFTPVQTLSNKNTKTYWHPFFGANPEKLALIQVLGISSASENPDKTASMNQDLLQKSGHYLAQSISGENAFLVSQGYYKVLRLPVGEYKYKVFQRPKGARRWQPSLDTAIASGLLNWKGRRNSLALVNNPTGSQ